MIIFNSKKIIFFHIPKCAGTSITNLLDDALLWNDLVIGGTPYGEYLQDTWSSKFGIYKHTSPSELKSVIGQKAYKSYKKFVISRNPLTRFFSAYYFIQEAEKKLTSWYVNTPEYRMNLFNIDLLNFTKSDYFLSIFHKKIEECTDIEKMFAPQSNFVDTEEYELGNFKYFRMEDLILSVKSLGDFLDIKNISSMPCLNKNLNLELTDLHFSNDISNYLQEKYISDISFFGY